MFEILPPIKKHKKYKRKFTLVVIADKQGENLRGVLDSIWTQDTAIHKFEVIIVRDSKTNVPVALTKEYLDKAVSGVRIVEMKDATLQNVVNGIISKKLKITGEYVMFIRGLSTLTQGALDHFGRMNGDILTMDTEIIAPKFRDSSVLFHELSRKRIKTYIRRAGLHIPVRMTTRYSTEFGKFFHERLFDKEMEMDSYEIGDSFVLYTKMIGRANKVFYYPKVCGVFRDEKRCPYRKILTKSEIEDYQRALHHISSMENTPTIYNKIIFLNLYELVKNHKGNIPFKEFDVDMEYVTLKNYYSRIRPQAWVGSHSMKKKIDKMREYLGRRIKL